MKSESHDAGSGIRVRITCYWNRKRGFWQTLESETALVELESQVPESFTTLI